MLRLQWPGSMAITFVCLCASALALAQQKEAGFQTAVNRAMAGGRGAAVVLDVENGKILAAYHPKIAAQRLAAPGSSIKPFTLKALLVNGKVDAASKLVCKRSLNVAGHRLDCSHPQIGQPLDAATALAYSCNTYFTTMAARLSPSELRE